MLRIGKWLVKWNLTVINAVTDEIVWFPGIGAWRREINRNV